MYYSATTAGLTRGNSPFEAIEDGNPDREGLMRLYIAQIPPLPRPLLAGDHTAWSRLSAPMLRDRTIEHHPTKVKGNKPITIGLRLWHVSLASAG
jgi:hypothetical protein